MKKYYKFYNIAWKVDFCSGIDKRRICLLSDYFLEEEFLKDIDFQIVLINQKYVYLEEVIRYGKKITIHNSKKAQVHEQGIALDDGMVRTIFNLATQSVYYINYISHQVYVYNEDIKALSRDYVRVVRDLVKIHMEEKNDAVMLHAAAVEKNDKGIIFVGPKGSGKTTISLELLYKQQFAEVSRDRTFLVKERNKYIILGWPNYYNLTYRTMYHYDALKKLLPESCGSLSEHELDLISEKRQFLADEIGITNKKRDAELYEIIFLSNSNSTVELSALDVFASSCYTPYDRNYIDWFSRYVGQKEKEDKAIKIYNDLIKQKSQMVSWNQINQAVDVIVRELNSEGKNE